VKLAGEVTVRVTVVERVRLTVTDVPVVTALLTVPVIVIG
jgi:hypothetical protein